MYFLHYYIRGIPDFQSVHFSPKLAEPNGYDLPGLGTKTSDVDTLLYFKIYRMIKLYKSEMCTVRLGTGYVSYICDKINAESRFLPNMETLLRKSSYIFRFLIVLPCNQ